MNKIRHVWLSGRLHIEGRLDEGPWLQQKKHKKYEKRSKAQQNKTNATPEKDAMTCTANQRPEDTSSRHLWLVNEGERTSTSPFALGYPLLGPSRHVRAYHCMP